MKLLIFIMLIVVSNAQTNLKIDTPINNLTEELEAAFTNSSTEGNFWLGYSIDSKSKTKISVGTYIFDDHEHSSLRELLTTGGNSEGSNIVLKSSGISKNSNGSVTIINGRIINDESNTDDTAILMRYNKSAKGIKDFKELAICNLSLNIDLHNMPLIWLGKADSKQSLDLLIKMYEDSENSEMIEYFIPAIGIHTDQEKVTNYLKKIFYELNDNEAKENLVFWIGVQNNNEAFGILKEIIATEINDIGEQAVMALSFIESDEALDDLIELAKHSKVRDFREHAIYGLGNRAVKKAELALKDFIENDPDIEIKKRAVYTLATESEKHLSYLIELAKEHPSLSIRKAAIYSLSSCEDERAVNAIIELAKN